MDNKNEQDNQEEEQTVTPWEVAAEKGGKIDYDKLIDKFGCQRLDQSLIDRVKTLRTFMLEAAKWWGSLEDLSESKSFELLNKVIIVTTRQMKVADIMKTLPSHCLKGLSEEDCWVLLRERAFGPEEEVPPQLERIGKRIVRKCAGAPLAAKALGGILKFKKREDEWEHVRDSEIWKLSAKESPIIPALRLSYHHLPLDLRQCFAYFAVFPKDHLIRKEELIHLWMAHGYISAEGMTNKVEDVGDEICNELLLRSLLQSDSFERISMHDLVHDLAELVMEHKVPGVQSERNLASASSTIRQVNLRDRIEWFPKTFQLDMNISSIMELTSLRVLDASRQGIKDLPPLISNLQHLRYLKLSTSKICTLPNSLCTLWNLKILDLDSCWKLVALPKKLSHLYNLQHLCLEGCELLSEMPSKMSKLKGLKTLSLFIVGLRRGNRLEELQCLNLSRILEIWHMERVKDHLDARKANIADKKNLWMLKLSWERNDSFKLKEEDGDEKVLEALKPHPNLKELHIQGFRGRFFPLWMTNSSLGRITNIQISDCQNCRRLPKLGELPHLSHLSLKNLPMVEYIIEEEDEVGSGDSLKIQFPSVESLYLYDLPNLKGLSKEQENDEDFPNLDMLEITHCSSFIKPPLLSLQKLWYLKCSSSTLGLLSEQDVPAQLVVEIEESVECFPIETVAKFSKLRELTIDGAKQISVTREGLQALKELISLRLENCDTMRCIPEGMLHQLTALKYLEINSCRELVELPGEEIKHLHNLEVLYICDLPKMACLPQALQHLSSLEILRTQNLPELESLPEQLPSSLRTLRVCECPKLVALPPLPNLKRLELGGCPELQRRCERDRGEDWHKIAHIRYLDILG